MEPATSLCHKRANPSTRTCGGLTTVLLSNYNLKWLPTTALLLWRENHRSVVPYVLPYSGRAVFGTAEAER